MFGWFKKKEGFYPKTPSKWNITAKEAIKKYGSAKAVLDEYCKDKSIKGDYHPLMWLMLMERREKLEKDMIDPAGLDISDPVWPNEKGTMTGRKCRKKKGGSKTP